MARPLRETLSDPDFAGLPPSDQRELLAELYPDFGALPNTEQVGMLAELMGGKGAPAAPAPAAARPDMSIGSNLYSGVLGSYASTGRLMANLSEIVGAEETGARIRKKAQRVADLAQQSGDDTWGGAVAQAVGAAPLTVAEVVAASAVAGPTIGLAVLGALSAADKGVWEMAKAAAIGGALGKATQYLALLPKWAQPAAFGTLFGTTTAVETGDPKQALAQGVVGTALGLPGVLPDRNREDVQSELTRQNRASIGAPEKPPPETEIGAQVRTSTPELDTTAPPVAAMPMPVAGAVAQETSAEPPASTTVIAPVSVPAREIPLRSLSLSRDVPNFKADASPETGVVPGSQLGGRYERLGTAPIVAWERTDGRLEVITGRHRLDLARRTGEETIPAQVVREADGFTRDMALTFDAESNIRDGQGSTKDYAHYFRSRARQAVGGVSQEDAAARGLLSRSKGRAGFEVGTHGSDDLYSLFAADKINDAQAVAISSAAPGNADLQRVGTRYALAGKSADFITNVLKAIEVKQRESTGTLDLFGGNDSALKSAEAQTEVALREQRAIREKISAASGASRRPEAARELGVDVEDPVSVRNAIAGLRSDLVRWEKWWYYPDLVARTKGQELSAAAGDPRAAGGEPQTEARSSTESPALTLNSGSSGGALTTKSSRGSGLATQEPPRQASTVAEPSASSTTRTASPSIQREIQTFRVGDIDPASSKRVLHEDLPVAGLIERASVAQPVADRLMQELAAAHGETAIPSKVKGLDRVNEKLATGRRPSTVADYLGGRISLERMDSAEKIARSLRDRGLEVLEDENMLFQQGARNGGAGVDSGYRARHLQVTLPETGMSFELQLIPREILEVVDGRGHKIYELLRNPDHLAAAAKASGKTPQEMRHTLEEESRALYTDAFARFKARQPTEPAAQARDDGPVGAEPPGSPPARGPPSGGPTPGRGVPLDIPDPTPRFRYETSVLGADEQAFVERVLLDPIGAAQQEVARRGVMTRGKVAESADQFPLSIEQALALPQGTILPVEGQQRMADYTRRAVAGVKEQAQLVRDAARSGDHAAEAAAREVLDARSAEAARLVFAFEAQGSEVGRALGIRAQGGISRTQAELMARRAMRSVMDDTRLPPEQREQVARRILEAGDDPTAIVAAIRNTYVPGWWQKFQELRVNMLVASPPTVLRDTVGNTAAAVSRLVENAVGIPIDIAYDAGQRRSAGPRSQLDVNRSRAREMGFDIIGTMRGTVEGLRLSSRALRDENYALTQGRIGQEVSHLPAIAGTTGKVVRVGTRIQSAADLLFRQINATGEVYRQSARQAFSEGLRGRDYWDRVEALATEAGNVDHAIAQRVSEGKLQPQRPAERIAGAGLRAGLEYTFQLPLGEFAARIDRARQSETLAGGSMKLVIPFFRTPINLGKFGAQRTAITGWFSPRNIRDIRSGNRDLAVAALSRMAVGTAASSALLYLASQGLITGAPEDDPAAREPQRRVGFQPFSIHVGDEWVDYRGFSPISEQLAVAASAAKSLERPGRSLGDIPMDLARVGLSIARTMVDQPYFTGPAQLVDLLKHSDEDRVANTSARVAGRTASGMAVPRVLAWLARSTDPIERAPADTVLGTMARDVPGLRQQGPAWRDPLGRYYEQPRDALSMFVRHSSDKPTSALDAWLFEIQESPDRAVVGYPARTQLGRRLSSDDWERLLIARGQLAIPALEAIRKQTQGTGEGSELEARTLISEAMAKVTAAAQDAVVPEAELRALGLEAGRENRATLEEVERSPMLRHIYQHVEDGGRRQLLELVQRAPSDPRAAAALRQMVLSAGHGDGAEAAPAAGGAAVNR